jgi:hypothetical protein
MTAATFYNLNVLKYQTCEPPARETKSTAFETLSRPPEKNKNLLTFQNFRNFFFLPKNIKNIWNSLDLII